jgi:SAM-dependent methyltransferase
MYMDHELFSRLAALPRLSRANVEILSCKICDGKAEYFDIVDFNKFCSKTEFYGFGRSGIMVSYFRCDTCGFVFTPFFDEWTTIEFGRFVYNADYIKIDGEYAGVRPKREAAALAKRLAGLTDLRILDYGSGTGLLADNLIAEGYRNVSSYDPFSSPSRPKGRFDLVTCFEVLEHTAAPMATMADIASLLEPSGSVIFSTGIQMPNMNEIRANWWYVGPRNGHASIFTLNALALAGQAAGLTLYAGPNGTAFAGSAPGETSAKILSSIGRPFRFLHLTAPHRDVTLRGEQSSNWHDCETTDVASYRWTRESAVVWRLQAKVIPAGQLTVTLPLQNEIEPGFADRCRLEIGTTSAPLYRQVGALSASLTLDEPKEAVIRLITPSPLSPADLGRPDDERHLGIAIRTGSATTQGGSI